MGIALTVPDGGSCSCCGCVAEIRSVTAYLAQVGYDPFDCDYLRGTSPTPAPQTPPYTRYLRYSVSGLALINACGDWNLGVQQTTERWDVDPFTGLSCRSGPPSQSVGFLCNPGFFGASSITSCGATSVSYDCGPEEYFDVCSNSTKTRPRTRTESLSSPYTIANVAQNVDTMLARVDGLVYNQMPAYTSGYVLNGTDHSALTWDPGASSVAKFIKGDTWVEKTRLYIKFLADTKYYLNEQEFQATKNQQIIVDAEEGDIVAFTPYCSKGFSPNNSFEYSGTKTTRSMKPGACALDFWTGPDCKQYNTRTEIGSASDESSDTEECSDPPYDESSFAGASESSFSYNKTERVSRSLEGCYKKDESSSGQCSGSNGGSGEYRVSANQPDACPYSESSSCNVSTTNGQKSGTTTRSCSRGGIPPCDGLECDCFGADGAACSKSTTLPSIDCCNMTPFGDCSCPGKTTLTQRTVQTFDPIVVSGSFTTTTLATLTDKSYTCEYTLEGQESGGDSMCAYNRKYSGESLVTVTFSNGDGGEDDWESETESNNSGCAGRFTGPTYEWISNALIIWDASYTLPTTEQTVAYTAYFHYVLTTNNTSNPDCPFVTVEAINEEFVVYSSGGQRLVTTSISVLAPGEDETACVTEKSAFLLKS